MNTPGKLTVGADGRVRGDIKITYNSPFPCVNGRLGVTGVMRGVLMHTMVGNLPGTDAEFNNPKAQVSAHFGVAQDGAVKQWGPLGKGWEAWHAMAANLAWYGIEHADDGNTHNPLTPAQISASAQLLEVLSRFAGFPLQVTDSTTGRGYGTHVMGGAAWGGHTCPGPGPRAAQRHAVVTVARAIRAGKPASPGPVRHVADGKTSLRQMAHEHRSTVEHALWLTATHVAGGFDGVQGMYVAAGLWDAAMPAGMIVWTWS